MRRRDFVAGAFIATAWGATDPTSAQNRPRAPRIAIVAVATKIEDITINGLPAFKGYFSELKRLGYVQTWSWNVTRPSGGWIASRTLLEPHEFASGNKTDLRECQPDVRFSNRPFGVKHFQTIHQCGVDVARGLLLLFGIGTWALPPWASMKEATQALGLTLVPPEARGPDALEQAFATMVKERARCSSC